MNLTKGHKNDIVRDILKDVPQIDYKTKIREYVQAEAVKLMPAAVLALYNDDGLRPFVATMRIYGRYYGSSGDCGYIHWVSHDPRNSTTLYLTANGVENDPLTQTLKVKVREVMLELCTAAEKQDKDRESMHNKLYHMLLPIRTLKQAKTLLEADLHKYLPVEPPKGEKATTGVALVPYVVDSLKEMGWPKKVEVAS
jgi:phosphoribosyl-ATP pyrophosphohydrolase